MMVATDSRTPIVAPFPEGIPAQMRATKRWAPWRAVWDEKKKKYEKVPHRATRPEFGLSNQGPAGWTTFDAALAAYRANVDGPPIYTREGVPIVFGGVGYLMTGPHGVTGVDLDHCVRDGRIDDWAAEIAAKLDSYTEISPSGTGLHIMVSGDVPYDWLNHYVMPGPWGRDMGIEVYAGHKSRFLCITGVQVPGSRGELRALPEGVMGALESRYNKSEKTKADVEDLHLPALVPPFLLPDLADLGLPPHVSNFLTDGPTPGDRSPQLYSASIALAQAGLAREEILSILEANEHAMEIALDHRRQDYDKALRYLWKEHCCAGTAKAEQIKADGFGAFDLLDLIGPDEPLEPEQAALDAAQVVDPADDFEDLDADGGPQVAGPVAPPKAEPVPRFTPVMLPEFFKRKKMDWIVKGLLPRGGLAVIYGASGSGKTFLATDIVGAVVTGKEWRGMPVVKGRGVYIVAEGVSGFRNRLEAYCGFHGIDPADVDIGIIPDAPNFLDKAQIKDLIKALKAFGRIDFVVVDTYARVLAGGNENDSKDTGLAVAHCDAISRITGAAVVLIHHSGKDATKGARGSNALRAAADLEIEVVQTREYRAATVTKMKDGEDGREFVFKLAEVALGEDEDGYPITSCVVEHRDAPIRRAAPSKPLNAHQAIVMRVVNDTVDLTGEGLFYAELRRQAIDQIPRDPDSKKDNRGRDIDRAMTSLIASEHLVSGANGVVTPAEKSE